MYTWHPCYWFAFTFIVIRECKFKCHKKTTIVMYTMYARLKYWLWILIRNTKAYHWIGVPHKLLINLQSSHMSACNYNAQSFYIVVCRFSTTVQGIQMFSPSHLRYNCTFKTLRFNVGLSKVHMSKAYEKKHFWWMLMPYLSHMFSMLSFVFQRVAVLEFKYSHHGHIFILVALHASSNHPPPPHV